MTVKEKKRGRPVGTGSQLTAASIVECARRLMQEGGKVPSIRRVSGELGVDPMAIYHYFSSKALLLEAVTVSLIEDIYEPQGSGDWQGELTLLCQSYLTLLQRHPGLLETLLSMQSVGPAEVFIERFRIALAPLQLEEPLLKDALDLMVDYLHGFALAMQCNAGQDTPLSIEAMEGPLGLFFKALSAEIKGPR